MDSHRKKTTSRDVARAPWASAEPPPESTQNLTGPGGHPDFDDGLFDGRPQLRPKFDVLYYPPLATAAGVPRVTTRPLYKHRVVEAK